MWGWFMDFWSVIWDCNFFCLCVGVGKSGFCFFGGWGIGVFGIKFVNVCYCRYFECDNLFYFVVNWFIERVC